jgi:hypothetical protein
MSRVRIETSFENFSITFILEGDYNDKTKDWEEIVDELMKGEGLPVDGWASRSISPIDCHAKWCVSRCVWPCPNYNTVRRW